MSSSRYNFKIPYVLLHFRLKRFTFCSGRWPCRFPRRLHSSVFLTLACVMRLSVSLTSDRVNDGRGGSLWEPPKELAGRPSLLRRRRRQRRCPLRLEKDGAWNTSPSESKPSQLRTGHGTNTHTKRTALCVCDQRYQLANCDVPVLLQRELLLRPSTLEKMKLEMAPPIMMAKEKNIIEDKMEGKGVL